MKKALATLLCAVLLLSLCVTATAETQLNTSVLTAYNISLAKDTNRLIVRTTSGSPYTLCDLDGNALTTEPYTSMSNYSYGLFTVKLENGTPNCEGIINADGKVMVPAEYGDTKILSERWQLGAVLEPATEDNFDYQTYGSDKQFFLVSRYDVYYMGTKVGELGRTDYNYGNAYGAYLIVRNVAGNYSAFDSSFTANPNEISTSSEFTYDYSSKTVYHVASGMAAFCEGCTLTPDDVEDAYYIRNGIVKDLQGNVMADLSEYYYTYDVSNGYIFIQTNDKKYGIVDLNGNVILAAELDDKIYNYNGVFSTGYELVSKDGYLCYADPTGIVSSSRINSSVSYRQTGAFTSTENADGTRSLFTPMGQIAASFTDIMSDSSNTGSILAVKNANEEIYVIGLAGEVVIPADSRCTSLYNCAVSNDGTVVVRSIGRNANWDYEYEIIRVSYDTEGVDTSALDAGIWNCECGYVNDNNYCPFCGTPRPTK